MRGKKYLLLAISLLFLFAITLSIIPLTAAPPTTYVKVYVDQPLGYIPFQTIGARFTFVIKIETLGFADATVGGIIAWKMDIRVDPNVLSIDTTVGPAPPFPPPQDCKIYTLPGHFLPTYASMMGYSAPSLFLGANDPATGLQDEIMETGMPSYALGAGDYVSGIAPNLLTVEITPISNHKPCLIDLVDVMYRTGDGLWHNVEYVEDGYYGQPPPTYLSNTDAAFDPTSPIDSTWHELYPNYCNNLVMTSFSDNGDQVLSASDQVDFFNETDGWTYWYHVDAVTVTIHWTFKIDETTPTDPAELGDGEPYEPHSIEVEDNSVLNPIGTTWHQIYPDYCREFVITSHIDTDGDGALDPSEQFDFVYQDEPGITYWAHLDSITTDLILSFKEAEPPVPEFPLGIGLIMALAPMIPVIYLWRKRSK